MLKIEVKGVSVPDYFKENGKLFLDISEESDVTWFSLVEELNEISEIANEAVFPISIPETEKNKYIISSAYYENTGDYEPIDVVVSSGVSVLRSVKIVVTGVTEVIELDLRVTDDHWIELFGGALVRDYINGTFNYTEQALINNWTNDFSYTDGDAGIYFPVAFYGKWFARDTTIVEDYRPWFHVLGILQRAFCAIGWKFTCPILESNVGRRVICYILDTSFNTQPRNALVTLSDEFLLFGTNFLKFDIEEDEFGLVNNDPFPGSNVTWLQGSGVYDLVGDVELVKGTNDNNTRTGFFRIFRATNGVDEVYREIPFTVDGDVDAITLNINTRGIQLNIDSHIVCAVQIKGKFLFASATVEFKSRRVLPIEGDTLDLKQMVNPDYEFLDFFKGIVHIFNGKFVTNYATREVTMLTPEDTTYFGDNVEGYYQNTVESIGEVLEKSRSVVINDENKARYVRLRFKDSTDNEIEKLDLPEAEPLYSREIDLGAKLNKEIEDRENPFFEPTLNKRFRFGNLSVGSPNVDPTDMPVLVDNDEGELSFKIGPRIAIARAGAIQSNNVNITDFTFKGTHGWLMVPYAWQKSDYTFGGNPIKENLVFGNMEGDLSRFWYNDLVAKRTSKVISFTVLDSFDAIKKLSFRNLIKGYYEGREWVLRLIAKEDVSLTEREGVLTLMPNKYVGCDAVPDPGDGDACLNFPKLLVSQNCFDYTLSSGGTAESTIETETIEVSFDGGVNWVEQSVIGCIDHSGENFIARLIVVYTDDCPTSVVSKIIRPCRATNLNVFCQLVDGCLTLTRTGVVDFCIDSESILYGINAAATNEYTEPLCDVVEDDVVNWKLVITSSCCDTIELEGSCTVPAIPFDCANVQLEFERVAPFWNYSRVGDMPSNVATDIVQYRETAAEPWTYVWGGRLRMESVQVQRVVVLTDGTVCVSEIYDLSI